MVLWTYVQITRPHRILIFLIGEKSKNYLLFMNFDVVNKYFNNNYLEELQSIINSNFDFLKLVNILLPLESM